MTNGKISPDDLRAILGVREANRIINAVHAARMEPLDTESIRAFQLLLDGEAIGHANIKIARVLRAYLTDHPTAAHGMRRWAAALQG